MVPHYLGKFFYRYSADTDDPLPDPPSYHFFIWRQGSDDPATRQHIVIIFDVEFLEFEVKIWKSKGVV